MSENTAFLRLECDGEDRGTYMLERERRHSLGRSLDNDIALPDNLCSRYHAIVYFEEGDWYVQDLGSRNGTFVNQELIRTPMMLSSGVSIRIGQTTLDFFSGEHSTDNFGGTGVFGISTEQGTAPNLSAFDTHNIILRQGQRSFLKGTSEETVNGLSPHSAKDSADLCRLAFDLGQATEVEQVAKIALEGVIKALDGNGVGLWLFPYETRQTDNASLLRLVESRAVEAEKYFPISQSLADAVLKQKEAVLVSDNTLKRKPERHLTVGKVSNDDLPYLGRSNSMAAPISGQYGIMGLLHIYTYKDGVTFLPDDLEYFLAISETVAVALANVHKQKELSANLSLARKENSTLRDLLEQNNEMIGNSAQIQHIHHLISRAATGKTTLLIHGESGTGKELIARAVHFSSIRRAKPLICINCAALSESLLESELFGHEKGAFTGATDRKLGKFEVAHTGTLFLDEIGEMTLSLQSKLLRVLEGMPFERVGGNTPILTDVRVIAATNRDLEKEVAAGRFRHDLFFRLRVLEIIVPPLRERTDDISLLASFFLDKFCRETGRKYSGFTNDAMSAMLEYRWPGNIRELKNVIERAVVLGAESFIQKSDLLLSNLGGAAVLAEQKHNFAPESLDDVEKNHILSTLEFVRWNKSLASRHLGIERTTLDRKIKRFGLEK